MTARWVVEHVQTQREITVTWQPISLLVKNNPSEDSDYFAPVQFTHKLLRVMESIRAADGDAAVQPFYWATASRIHQDGDQDFSAQDALTAAGFDPSHAAAFDDESFDAEIKRRMDIGLGLTGDDVGTPIISMDDANGETVALFGPVISRMPEGDAALQLWDGLVACATTPGFWELKRTRSEDPDFPAMP